MTEIVPRAAGRKSTVRSWHVNWPDDDAARQYQSHRIRWPVEIGTKPAFRIEIVACDMAKRQSFELGPDFESDIPMSQVPSEETYYVTSEADLKKLPPQVRKLFEQARKEAGGPGGIRLAGDVDQMKVDVNLIERAQMIIDVVRQAEENSQWDMARGFMSARLFSRWQPWAQGLVNNRRPIPQILSRQVAPVDHQSHATHDIGTVRVTESAPTVGTIRTLWVFLRNASARSGQEGSIFAGVCTNCGAPVDPIQNSTCRYCGAGVVNLGPEWLLDDIRPDSETVIR